MIKKIVTTLRNTPKFPFLKRSKKKISLKKEKKSDFDFKDFFEKQKKSIYDFIGKSDDSDTHLSNVIEDMIKEKFHLKGGYGDLIANEEKYEQFVRTLGYEYYATYNELSKYYQDTSFQLDEKKLEFCTTMYIITLEDKKNKNKVLGIRDVVNLDFEILSKFYFTKIVVLGEGVLSSVFGEDREIIFNSNSDTENDEEINKYFDKMMGQAILLGASDIHIQKTSRYASLWFRIDGIKVDMGTMPITIAKTLKRRLVTMADQEDSDYESINGVINYEYGKKNIKFRLGLINSKLNFSLVMRMIGGRGVVSHNLSGLNYPEETIRILSNLTKYANGMILITGQVGSGKTHLMYALLQQLAKQQQYVITIEDPVEYVDESFFQIDLSEFASASEEFKYGYPEAVVDILRQDSNIILIGETREPQTASQLVNASNLGQLVFSTMHTNSAPATVSRMTSSLGINEGDIIDNLRGIVSQRLVRKLCSYCKEPDGEGGYKKVGCDECNHTGFKDRVPIAEVVRFKLGHGGDFENPAEYMTVEKASMAQYKEGLITKEDAIAIIRGEEVWYD
ncbi:MAG: ATPase, T2SS/T4P/T4SS family [Arcobacter sp.]|jgi:type II secretory ATPase GspE/PulE/Tfp pilus assembly ATPase PilB-like protein|uniref:GspE/PulE family protein n=1 Tax=Arcobacter sp. TaxID=1872629 RepID=UPI002A761E1E|nr:ATPase, T2SS/T4P/T4SS family [Arcobacter sp.]MDY3205196.1 ATPase, T2SS/T4P/T4SS family [Arcobacter sp.]